MGICPDGGEPNCIGGMFAGAVVVGAAGAGDVAGAAPGEAMGVAPGEAMGVAAGDAIGVAAGDAIGVALGAADAAGEALGVACAIALVLTFPDDAWRDGAATAVSPRLATISAVRTPVLSRFNVAS